MSCQIKNNANLDLADLQLHLDGMYDHFNQKLGFQKPPVIVFDTDPSNQSNVLGKTAYYDPQSLEIHIFIDGRHPKDMLRSIAHELIHHQQNLEGRLNVGGYNGPGYYLKNDKMKEIEQEAMLEGNAILREYEDTVKHMETKNMSLKEWKNNELNQLLMKKFGILKEEKGEKGKYDGTDSKHAAGIDADADGAPDGGDKDKNDPEVQEESVSGRKEDSDRRQGKDREHSDRLREDDGEELEESNCGSHKRDDDVSEGKECAKCEPEECKCEKIEEGSSTPDKLREAIRRISKAKKVFLNKRRIK
tara:strand:- start:2569 stop:3480 length:912 start_codon:yes stop_codon:yes gene_type:complete